MKKFLSAFLSLTLILGAAGTTASAASLNNKESGSSISVHESGFTSGGFSFSEYGDSITITGFDDETYGLYNAEYKTNHVLKIPDYVEGKPVTAVSLDGTYNPTFTTVIIPKAVVSIDFSGINSLEYVNIEEGSQLTKFGYNPFQDCQNLKRIGVGNTDRLPDGITVIGDVDFNGCTSLKSITFPDGLKEIGDHAFSGCESLTSISIPATIVTIGYEAFKGCTQLKSVVFETYKSGENKGKNDLKYFESGFHIGGQFMDCTNLSKVELALSTSTYKIPENCFRNTALEGINIPESVTSIGANAFANTKLTNSLETENGEKYAIGIFNKKLTFETARGEYIYGSWNIDNIFGDTYDETSKDEKPTIGGYTNSSANDFALKNDFNFVSFGDWNPYDLSLVDDPDEESDDEKSTDSSTDSSKSSDKDSSTDSSKSSDKDSSTDSSKSSDKDSSTDSSKSSDKDSSTDSSKSSDKDSNTDSSKSSDKDSNTDSSKSSDKDSNTDSSKSSDKDSDTDSSKSSDKDSDTDSSKKNNTNNSTTNSNNSGSTSGGSSTGSSTISGGKTAAETSSVKTGDMRDFGIYAAIMMSAFIFATAMYYRRKKRVKEND